MERLRRVVGVFGVVCAGMLAAVLFMLPPFFSFSPLVCVLLRILGGVGVVWLALVLGCRHARRERLVMLAHESVGALLEEAMRGGDDLVGLYHVYLVRLAQMSECRWAGLILEDELRLLVAEQSPHPQVAEMDGRECVQRIKDSGLWERVVTKGEHVLLGHQGQEVLDLLDLFPGGLGRRSQLFRLSSGDVILGLVILAGCPHRFSVVRRQFFDGMVKALGQGICHRMALDAQKAHEQEREAWASELAERIQALEESERRFRRLVENSADAVMIVGLDGHVVYVNPAAATFYGRSQADLLGHPVESIGEPGGHGEIRVYPPGGELRWGEVRTVDIEWHGASAFLVSVRDITKRKRAEQALQRHKDQLEELVDARTNELRTAVGRLELHNRAKSEFVSNVSHELRTPLASLRSGLSNVLRGICGPLEKQVVSYLSMLHEECERLILTVEDILDVSRIEMGRLKLYCMPAPIARICHHSVEMLRVAARTKSIELTLGYAWCRLFVNADMAKLERVCANIVENAIKYTPDGGRVSVALERDGDHVLLRVCDSGVGIAREDLPHVLERYYRVGTHVDGMGVGLALSAEIVRAHDGQLTVSSPPVGQTEGTEVCVRLAVVPAPTIGIVDGLHGVGYSAGEDLKSLGYEVRMFRVDDAVGPHLVESGVDLLVIDMSEPGMDGLEVLARLRQQPVGTDLPVLVLVGSGREETKRQVVRNLNAHTLDAPYGEGRLLGGVRECLVQRRDVPFVRPVESDEGQGLAEVGHSS